MANYSNLKTAIENAVDWNNGDNEITGQNLLDILETIIDSLGAKYKFADVATPSSSITTPDEPLFYLAGAGTYTNFSGLSVTIPRGTLAIFYYDTAWHYTTVRTDSDAFFNVNQYLGAPSTTYTKANARNAVPSDLRSKGMIITYLTTDGWIIEQNLSTSGTWNADANWQTIGPVSVSQNTNTKGQQLYIGGVKTGNIDDFYNVNSYNNKGDAYTDASTARNAVPAGSKALGMVITYLLADGWYIEQFIGSDISGWGTASNWETIGPVKVENATLCIANKKGAALPNNWVISPEYMHVDIDEEDKILSGKYNNGVSFENVGLEINGAIETPTIEVKSTENIEYKDVLLDEKDGVISGLREDNTLECNIPVRLKGGIKGDVHFIDGVPSDIEDYTTDRISPLFSCMFNPKINLLKDDLKILDIGNSFTEDATLYINSICESYNVPANFSMYKAIRGGASFKNWVDVINGVDGDRYYISKVAGYTIDGIAGEVPLGHDNTLIVNALESVKWDIIIIHQYYAANDFSQWKGHGNGGYLDELISLLRQYNNTATIGYLFPHSYNSSYNQNVEQSSLKMWKNIAKATALFSRSYDVDFIIPYGTAIQNLRETGIDPINEFCHDGQHIADGAGNYCSGLCYFQILLAPRFDKCILGNTFRITGLDETQPGVKNVDDTMALICQKAAFLACYNRFELTNIN